jgi:hypothetical protein
MSLLAVYFQRIKAGRLRVKGRLFHFQTLGSDPEQKDRKDWTTPFCDQGAGRVNSSRIRRRIFAGSALGGTPISEAARRLNIDSYLPLPDGADSGRLFAELAVSTFLAQ